MGCLAFITFVNWDYQVRCLFPVMPACYYFSLYAVQNIYNWVQIILAGKSYFPALRAVVFFRASCLAGYEFSWRDQIAEG